MAEVEKTRVPSKQELGKVFDDVFGAEDAEGADWVEGTQEAVETQPEEVVEAPPEEEVVEQEASTEAEQVAEEVTEEVIEPKPVAPKKKDAQDRIQQLAREKNQLREELQKTQQYFNHQLEQIKQQGLTEQKAQRQALEQQLELQRRQFDKMQEREEAAEFEKLPIDQKIQLRAKKEAKAEAQAELLAERRARLEFEQKFLAREQATAQQAERNKRLANLDNQAESVLDNIVLKDLDPADMKALRPQMKEMLMSWCGSYGEYPQDAGPRFTKYMNDFFSAKLKTKRNPNVKRPGVQAAVKQDGQTTQVAVKRVPAKRTVAEAYKQGGLRASLNDLADELFGR